MDGLLIIDKPAGITSHDVVARVRRALQTKRVGHTGTLDPFATGVMVILVGKATRLAQFLDKDEKEYEAVIRFGFETDTGDNTGTPKHAVHGATSIDTDQVESVLARFRGTIRQTPPMYSAKKVDGQKLYELARRGVVVDRKPVEVSISKLEILSSADTSARIRVGCSAGTYIRTLAEDIGREIGIGAHLTELRRTRAGRFTIDEAVKLDDVGETDLRPVELAVEHLPAFSLREDRVAKTLNGMSTRDLSGTFADGELVRMTVPSGELVAIGFFDDAEKVVQPKVVLG
jgi:tRNA pseudouridine55 synthase